MEQGEENMKKVSGLLILLSVFMVPVLWAQPGQGNGPRPGNGPGNQGGAAWGKGQGFRQWDRMGPGGLLGMQFNLRGLWRLDLSDAQKEQIRSLFEGMREETRELMEELRDVRSQLNDLPLDESFDASALEALAQQQGALTAQLTVASKQLQHEIYLLLTEEQRAELEQMGQRGPHPRWGRRGN